MKICLKTEARQIRPQPAPVVLKERLPFFVHSPSELMCHFQVESYDAYYLMRLVVQGVVTITCQRCLEAFRHDYNNQTTIAICRNEVVAETMMDQFECMVVSDGELDLVDVVTDDMYLFLPEKHPDFLDCDREICQLIGKDNDLTNVI